MGGAASNPTSPHFLPLLIPLVKHDARVLVVAGGPRGAAEADETATRLQRTLTNVLPDGWSTYGEGFGTFVEAGDRLLQFVEFFRL